MVRCFLYVKKSQLTKGEHHKGRKGGGFPALAGLFAVAGLWAVTGKMAACRFFEIHREVHDICLSVCGEQAWLKGLVDTGNCLYDSPGKEPVCVMDKAVMKQQFPRLEEKLHTYLKEGNNDESLRLHYLAYCSLGRPDGVALAFTAEYLLVQKNRSKRKTIHPHIAVAESSLLFGRGYQIILNPDVLRKREE